MKKLSGNSYQAYHHPYQSPNTTNVRHQRHQQPHQQQHHQSQSHQQQSLTQKQQQPPQRPTYLPIQPTHLPVRSQSYESTPAQQQLTGISTKTTPTTTSSILSNTTTSARSAAATASAAYNITNANMSALSAMNFAMPMHANTTNLQQHYHQPQQQAQQQQSEHLVQLRQQHQQQQQQQQQMLQHQQQYNFNYMQYNNYLQQQQQQHQIQHQYNANNFYQHHQQQPQQQQLQLQLTPSQTYQHFCNSANDIRNNSNNNNNNHSTNNNNNNHSNNNNNNNHSNNNNSNNIKNNNANPSHLALPTPKQETAESSSIGENSNDSVKFTMDANEIANFLATELFVQQLASVDGMQSGVPTLTTPTLTPTTLRSIEETFIQITQEPSAPYQAGFIPPSFNTDSCGPLASTATPSLSFSSTMNGLNEPDNSDSEESRESWEGTVNFNEDNSQATDDTSSAATDSTSFQNGLNGLGNNSHATSNASSTNDFSFALAAGKGNLLNTKSLDIPTTTSTPRRNQGGRRPAKSTNMSPEEEEKRRVRRERNKLAAARCRKRRVDQTNELLDEVAALEKKREQLQREVEQLNTEKGDLHYLIQAHLPACQMRSHLKNAFESLLGGAGAASANTANTTNSHSNAIGGLDETLASAAGRSNSPIDLKPMLSDNSILSQIKSEPLDVGLDSNSSDGEPSPKRILRANPMIPPPLPNVATLSPSLAAAAAANSSLNTPVVTMAPVSFSSFCNNNSNTTLNALNSTRQQMKQRPNSLPMQPRNLGLNVDAGGHKAQPPTEINGVAIQTPSTGTFNYDSLMDGGTGLTPVSGPLIPTCSSQNKHPLELATPTSEPSKLVSL